MTEEAQKAAAALRLVAEQVEAGAVSEVEIKVAYHSPAVLIDAIRQTFEPPKSCSRCRPIAIVTTPQRIRRDVADQIAGGMLVTRAELEAIVAVLAAGDRIIDGHNQTARTISKRAIDVFVSQHTAVGGTIDRFTKRARAAIGR